jgi:hypothetical protein
VPEQPERQETLPSDRQEPDSPAIVDLMSLRGILKSPVTGITLDDMKEAIHEAPLANEWAHHA